MGADRRTVCRDLAAIREEWRVRCNYKPVQGIFNFEWHVELQ